VRVSVECFYRNTNKLVSLCVLLNASVVTSSSLFVCASGGCVEEEGEVSIRLLLVCLR